MDPEKQKNMMKMLLLIGVILWLIGFLMAISALTIEFTTFKPALEQIYELPKATWENADRATNPDLVDLRIIANSYGPMLLTLKLVGIAFILSGVFLSLIAIQKALTMIPVNLGMMLKGKQG